MAAYLNTCTSIEYCGVVLFLWEKGMAERLSTKKWCPCTVNIACNVKQSTIGFSSSRRGEQVSKTNIESVGRWRLPRWQRILHRRFPGNCETVGEVFKFARRLHWQTNVCMSLSAFVSFQSWFVTFLLTFPRIKEMHVSRSKIPNKKSRRAA
jgi:hypothetical protein